MSTKEFNPLIWRYDFFKTNEEEIFSIRCVGSRFTCNPPPEASDWDFLINLNLGSFNNFTDYLKITGWEVCGGSEYIAPVEIDDEIASDPSLQFQSWRKEIDGVNVNIIITESESFYNRFLYATELAKNLNLMEKQSRVALFQHILYGQDLYLRNDLDA